MMETQKILHPVAISFPVRVNVHELLHQMQPDIDMDGSLAIDKYFQDVERLRAELPKGGVVTAIPRVNGRVDLVAGSFSVRDARRETYTRL